tara:strand:- start:1293 stop:2201 length:909 start_codon:yes stop_codon:yes gene_type:complete
MKNFLNNSDFNFIKKFKICGYSSLILILIGFSFFIFKGPELGIDFKGGIEIIIDTGDDKSNIDNIKSKLNEFFDKNGINVSNIKSYGIKKMQILVEDSDLSLSSFRELISSYEKNELSLLSFNKIGSTISNELTTNAMQALFIAILLIGFYIIIRFDWYSSIGSIIAIIHDILIVMSLLVIFNYQFDINIIAAFLIIIGYSLNDTIVVFDRIRENLDEFSNMDLEKIINLSINETLSRTTITSLTTLFVLLSLLIFGGNSLSGLSFALVIGIITGTYSSIFIATPVMMNLRIKYFNEENIKE